MTMKVDDTLKFEERLNSIKNSWAYFDKYYHISTGKVEYTNNDIDELLDYYTQKEKYEMCKQLVKLKK